MEQKGLNYNRIAKALFFLMPVFYFFLYGFWGIDNADLGFIPGLSHRILEGEVIHKDFFYVRPPLSPFLHTLEIALLPQSWEGLGMRFVFYWMMLGSVWFSLEAIRKFFDLESYGVNSWLFGIVCFIYGVHNFPPMPWHTTDGIFFASLSVYLITRGPALHWGVLGIGASLLAAMAKQPFGIVPIMVAGSLLVLYPWKQVAKMAAVAGGIVLAVALILEFMVPAWPGLSPMLDEVRGSSGLQALRRGAYQLYVRPGLATAVPVALALFAANRFKERYPWLVYAPAVLIGLFFVAFAAYQIKLTFDRELFTGPVYGPYHAMLFGGGLVLLIRAWYKRKTEEIKGLVVLITMCGIDWASGISWGYVAPILYIAPGLFGLVYLIGQVQGLRLPRWAMPAWVVVGFVTYAFSLYYPYREAARPELTYHLGEIFPQYTGIYSSEQYHDQLSELKNLHGQYGDNLTVLPGLPQAHYLLGITNPIGVDWAHDCEVNGEAGIQHLIDQLETKRPVVLAEKSHAHEATLPKENGMRCSTLAHVFENWMQVGETKQFTVWVHPERDQP